MIIPASTPAHELGTFARPLERLVEGLRQSVRPDGVVWDAVLNAPSPSDHYAQTSTALTLQLHGHQRESTATREAWLSLKPKELGHLPFNRFILLLLTRAGPGSSSSRDQQAIDRGLKRCKLAKHYPSNNWSLLAQLCRLIESADSSRPTGSKKTTHQNQQARIFCQLLDRWMTDDGVFIDYPDAPQGAGATPTTYHLKALFLATTAAWLCDEPALNGRIEKLLGQAMRFWDGEGLVGGLGRSSHALFGDGCLLASLILLGAAEGGQGDISAMLDGVIKRLDSQRRPDGLYWLNPAGAEGQEGWDGYMYISVYNAWFAAIVSWALFIRRVQQPPKGLAKTWRESPSLQGNALFCVRKAEIAAMFATCGQPPQAFSHDEVELRYAGGAPIHLRVGSKTAVPPGCRITGRQLLSCPALAGWTPVLCSQGTLYGLTDFDTAQTEVLASNILRFTYRGSPAALLKADAGNFAGRLAGAVDWRLLHGALGRKEALNRTKLPGIEAKIVYTLDLEEPGLSLQLSIENSEGQAVDLLNPAGHALVWSTQLRSWEILFDGKRIYSRLEAQTSLISADMPTAIARAKGYCLPRQRLRKGTTSYGVALNWSIGGEKT